MYICYKERVKEEGGRGEGGRRRERRRGWI